MIGLARTRFTSGLARKAAYPTIRSGKRRIVKYPKYAIP
jgi:hypothetical protein